MGVNLSRMEALELSQRTMDSLAESHTQAQSGEQRWTAEHHRRIQFKEISTVVDAMVQLVVAGSQPTMNQ